MGRFRVQGTDDVGKVEVGLVRSLRLESQTVETDCLEIAELNFAQTKSQPVDSFYWVTSQPRTAIRSERAYRKVQYERPLAVVVGSPDPAAVD